MIVSHLGCCQPWKWSTSFADILCVSFIDAASMFQFVLLFVQIIQAYNWNFSSIIHILFILLLRVKKW